MGLSHWCCTKGGFCLWLSHSCRSDPYDLLFVTSSDHFLHVCIPPKVSVIGPSFFFCGSREVLRWAVFSMQAAGHILLGSSCYIEYLLQEEQATQSLSLPQESRIRQLQSMLLGRASQGWWTRTLWWWREHISLKFSCAVFAFCAVTRLLSIRKTFSQMLFPHKNK